MTTSDPGVPKRAPLQASKWLQLQALLGEEEMEALFQELGNVRIFLAGQLVQSDLGEITTQEFLSAYSDYIGHLKNGEVPDPSLYRPYFSSVLALSQDDLFAIPAGDGKRILRPEKPIVQLQLHTLGYSSLEEKFRPMIMGKESIHWGIQFSYPQLTMDPETKEVEKAMDPVRFPNTEIFRKLQKWIRGNTVPTPFQVGERTIRVPMRLGKHCFAWINQHPQLKALGIKVAAFSGGAA